MGPSWGMLPRDLIKLFLKQLNKLRYKLLEEVQTP